MINNPNKLKQILPVKKTATFQKGIINNQLSQCPFLHCNFQVLKKFPIKITATSSLIYFCLSLPFASVDIIFHTFLNLHSTLSEKRFFFYEFSFIKRFTQYTLSLHDRKLLNVTNFFSQCSLNFVLSLEKQVSSVSGYLWLLEVICKSIYLQYRVSSFHEI